MSKSLRRVGLVVEGETERKFFEHQRGWFKQSGIALIVVTANGKPRMVQEANQHLTVLRLKGCERVFFLIDQDESECAPVVAKALQSVRSQADVVVCVIARKLESWILADSAAIQKATGEQAGTQATDSLPAPDKKLHDLFYRKTNRHMTKMEIIQRVNRHFSLERCAHRNGSARRFLGKLGTPGF